MQLYVNDLLGKRLRWYKLEPCFLTSTRERYNRVNWSPFSTVSAEQQETETEEEDGILEYDSSSDDDLEEGDNEEADNDIGSLDREANFLLGMVSRFGRTIRFNKRIVF